jgi:RNA polymerase sigma-70 factor (ECF subfamily)
LTTGADKAAIASAGLRSTRGAPLDPRDFASVYYHTCRNVSRWIRALGGPVSEQDDLIQDIYVIVHRKLPHFDGKNLGAWLYRITVNRVRDFRRLWWWRHVLGKDPLAIDKLESNAPNSVRLLETAEKRRELERLLSKLSVPVRATFILFEIDGYTAVEIAELQALSVHTVRARISRARKKLLNLINSRRKRTRSRTRRAL